MTDNSAEEKWSWPRLVWLIFVNLLALWIMGINGCMGPEVKNLFIGRG